MNYKDENGIAETTDMDVECDENGGKSAPCPIYVFIEWQISYIPTVADNMLLVYSKQW